MIVSNFKSGWLKYLSSVPNAEEKIVEGRMNEVENLITSFLEKIKTEETETTSANN